ncbi:MAG: SMP-30/gluconolactonase/LRE family protein [Clostridia bacterium]|nr:SMP-30/gluconolactonase/LRE family protein [Clostridia bacterium]
MYKNIELITDALCIVGEGPVFDEKNNRLLMLDIQGKRLRSIDWSTLKVTDTVLPQQIGFLFFDEQDTLYGAAEDGIYKILNGSLVPFSKPCEIKGMRFNDGKVGPDGCLYGGTFSRDNSAAFYKMGADGRLTELFDKVGNSNGLAFSPDEKHFYYNDTPTGRTDVFSFEDGILSDRRPLITYSGGKPDGMTIDADGNLWTALWGGGTAVKVNTKTGEVMEKIELPVSQVACCAFAGKDLKTLVITTAAHGVSLRDEPLAGATFAVNLDVGGIKDYKFKLER